MIRLVPIVSQIQLAAPQLAVWGLLALPIIALFILRVRLRREPVSTLLFWDQLMEDRRRRAWWQRLRNPLSLLLQLLLVGLVIAALVDPLWSWQAAQPRRVVLVVDNSASMNARLAEDAANRLDEARGAAGTIVRSLRDRDRMAVVTAGGLPRVHLGMTDDLRRLQTAVETVPETDSPDQLPAAVTLARQLLAGETAGEIIVLTDGGNGADSLRDVPSVSVYGVGRAADNVAITAFQVRRSIADALSYQILVEVTNFGRAATDRRLEIDLEDSPVDVVPLHLEAGQVWRQTLDHSSVDGGRLVARLAGSEALAPDGLAADALAADDVALAVLPRRDPVPVVLVTPGNLFLQNVFASIPGVALTVTSELPAEIATGTILVLHRTIPNKLPPGPMMVIAPETSTELWQIGDELASPLVSEQADDSPLLAHLRLQNVSFTGARRIQFSAEAEPLLTSPSEVPMYVRLPRQEGDVLVLDTELDQGDLPLRIAFPVMMKNAVEWFLGTKGELQPALATGQTTVIRVTQASRETIEETPTVALENGAAVESPQITAVAAVAGNRQRPEASARWVLRSPAGERFPLSAHTSALSIGPLQSTGLWMAGPREVLFGDAAPDPLDERVVPLAVNLTSAAESDLRKRPDLDPPPAPALAGMGGYSMWVYLVALAVVGLVGEWFLYQRRVVA